MAMPGKLLEDIKKEAALLYGKPMPTLSDSLFEEYFLTGNRLNYEAAYFTRRKYLTVFGILSTLGEYDKILDTILSDICSEKTWALPPHIDRNSKNWEYTIDLFAAETAFALAEIVSVSREQISSPVKELVIQHVMKRVLLPFQKSASPYAWWEVSTMNWCAVCCGCIGAAGIWLLEEGMEKNQFLKRILASLTSYLQGYPDDGTCQEGLNYYYYGIGHIVLFQELLERKTPLLTNWKNKFPAKLKNIAFFPQKCLLYNNHTVSFSDSSRTEHLRIGLQSWFQRMYPEIQIPGDFQCAGFHDDPCYRYSLISRDILLGQTAFSPGSADTKPLPASYYLPDAQWYIERTKNLCAFAVKGGHNDEPHNHNDVGSFLYMANGELVLDDLGSGEYTKDYFGEKRYQSIHCRSMGHNLPLINGCEECAGIRYHADSFHVTKSGDVTICLASAYPEGLLRDFRRQIAIDKISGILSASDTFAYGKPVTITENFVTLLPAVITNHGFLLYGSHGNYSLHITNGDSVSSDAGRKGDSEISYSIREVPFNRHDGTPATAYLLQAVFQTGTCAVNFTCRTADTPSTIREERT